MKEHTSGTAYDMPSLENRRFEPFGKCIYCAKTSDLTDEHIIPFGLGGTTILPESSCTQCAAITSKFERSVLRGELWTARVYLALQSRSNHEEAPKSFPLEIVKRGKKRTYNLAIENYPVLLHFPRFDEPGVWRPDEYSKGIQIKALDTILLGPSPEEVAARLGASSIKFRQRKDPNAFARLIAKIAYGVAAAHGFLNRLDSPSPLLPAILGKKDNIGKWVGCFGGPNIAQKGRIHDIELIITEDNHLIAEVQIFRIFETPRYIVFLGTVEKTANPG